jgi:hypothetical protein
MSKPDVRNGILDSLASGLTLRDVFAAVAMHAIMSKHIDPQDIREMMSYLPSACYMASDYMLAERAASQSRDTLPAPPPDADDAEGTRLVEASDLDAALKFATEGETQALGKMVGAERHATDEGEST